MIAERWLGDIHLGRSSTEMELCFRKHSFWHARAIFLRIPMMPATYSDAKPATHSEFIPATIPA